MATAVSTTRTLDLSAVTLSTGVTYREKADIVTHDTEDDSAWAPHLYFNRVSADRIATASSETWTTTITNLRVSLEVFRGASTLHYWDGGKQTFSLEHPDSGENIVVEVAYGPGFNTWATVGSEITPTSVTTSSYTTINLDHTFTASTPLCSGKKAERIVA
jgi:hypothetical protein